MGWGQKGRLLSSTTEWTKRILKMRKGNSYFFPPLCVHGEPVNQVELIRSWKSLYLKEICLCGQETPVEWETGLREGQAWQQLPKQAVQSGLPTRGLNLKAKQRLLTGWLKKMDSFWAGRGEEERHSVLGGPGHLRAEGDDNGCKAKPVLWHKTANPLR